MKKLGKTIFLAALFCLAINSFVNSQTTCTLEGTVIDRDSDTLMLRKMTEDFRFVKIFIPIVDGKFEYTMELDHIEAWDLTFKDEFDTGGWRPIEFFPDKKKVIFELHPFDQPDNNIVKGGKLNNALAKFKKTQKEVFRPFYEPLEKTQDSLSSEGLYRTSEYKQLIEQVNALENGPDREKVFDQLSELKKDDKVLTPTAKVLKEEFEKISEKQKRWRYDYILNNKDIVSYSFILYDLLTIDFGSVDISEIIKVYPVFAAKFPRHPYTSLMAEMLKGNDEIKVGGQFIDFSLPDLKGKTQTLSQLIEGQVAIIDLWATWCGPCIRHTREFLPIYNEYHDKGFTIVGIAAERKNTEAMEKRLEIEKWPWINLVELDHQNNIWHKYGASFGGGIIVMVDQNGEVIAINPKPEEVVKHLERLL